MARGECKYLRKDQLEELAAEWRKWYETDTKDRRHHYVIFLILLRTGARVSEALSLQDDDFGQVEKSIRMPTLKQKIPTYRMVNLPKAHFNEVFDLWSKLSQKKKQAGMKYKTFLAVFKQAVAATSFDAATKKFVTPHTLRHSKAKALIDLGCTLPQVQKRLGHSSVSVTNIYVSVLPQEAEQSIVEREEAEIERERSNGTRAV